MLMVMQVPLRKRVDRHHPELLGQPFGALAHVCTVSAKASLTWLASGGRFGGGRSCCRRGVWWALVFGCWFCGCACELNEALSQLVAFFPDGEDGDGDGDAGSFTTTS